MAIGGAAALLWSARKDAPTLFAEASQNATLQPPKEPDFHVDPSTKQRLPVSLERPVSLSHVVTQRGGDGVTERPFVLIASGVRTVSFLRLQVYVAALYVEEAAPNEADFWTLRCRLPDSTWRTRPPSLPFSVK